MIEKKSVKHKIIRKNTNFSAMTHVCIIIIMIKLVGNFMFS
jgi:hypothetical protein